jgi:uncharacterized damage-inducible protein DinB
MNYYGAKQLADSFRTVRKNTITIANDIDEKHYGYSATPETRTVAQTLVHIAFVPMLQEQIQKVERRTTLDGFDFSSVFGKLVAEEKAPRSKQQIVALLQENGDRFASWLETVSDDFLGEQVTLPAMAAQPPKTRFEMLLGVKEHEMHHRGQLMLLERLVGVVPHLTREMMARMASMQGQTAGKASA